MSHTRTWQRLALIVSPWPRSPPFCSPSAIPISAAADQSACSTLWPLPSAEHRPPTLPPSAVSEQIEPHAAAEEEVAARIS